MDLGEQTDGRNDGGSGIAATAATTSTTNTTTNTEVALAESVIMPNDAAATSASAGSIESIVTPMQVQEQAAKEAKSNVQSTAVLDEETFESLQSEVESEDMQDAVSVQDLDQSEHGNAQDIEQSADEPAIEMEQSDQEEAIEDVQGEQLEDEHQIDDDEGAVAQFDPLINIGPLLNASSDDEVELMMGADDDAVSTSSSTPDADGNMAADRDDEAVQNPFRNIGPLLNVSSDDEVNLMMDEDDDAASTASSTPEVYGDVEADEADGAAPNRGGRIYVHSDFVRAAIREIIAQGRRGEAGVPDDMLNRGGLGQHLRRIIFSLNHNRRRTRSSSGISTGNGSGQNRSLDVAAGGSNESNENNENMDDIADEVEDPVEEEAAAARQRSAINEETANSIRFDTNLPAEHSYLGANMNRVAGVNYLDVGQQYRMMLFMHQHILFPGEILPFMISGTIIESEDIDAQNGLLFGACFPFLCNNEQDTNLYGVTCQIYEKGTDSRGNTLIKARALQRFITNGNEFSCPLQYIAAHPQFKCYGFIKILPEIFLPEPLDCINMGSMTRFRDEAPMQQMYKRYQAATTPWPAHVYDFYSISSIIEKARTQLAQHKIDTMPTDPIQLSFWLVRNLHLSESMMKTIFLTDSVNTRMKLIASTFKEASIFTCRYCGNRIANCRELFAMSKHGVQTQYCNSAGYIHETNTVYQLLRDAVSYSGAPSTEFSWFPGYQWHIVVCKICSRHIGWEFKAVEGNLVPKSFFGISSSSVRISSALYVPTDPRAVIYRSFLRFVRREMQ